MTSNDRPERAFGPAETLGYVGAALLVFGSIAAVWSGVTDPTEWVVRALLFGAVCVVALGTALTVALVVSRGSDVRRRIIATALAAGFLGAGLALNEIIQGSAIWTVSSGGSLQPTGVFLAAALVAVLALVGVAAFGSGVLLMETVIAAILVAVAAPSTFADASIDVGVAIAVGIGLLLVGVSLLPRFSRGQREFLRLVGVVLAALPLEVATDFQPSLSLVAIGIGLLALLAAFQPRPILTGLAVGGAIAFGTALVEVVTQTVSGQPLTALVVAGVGLALVLLGGLAGLLWHRPRKAPAPAVAPGLPAPAQPAGALPAPGPEIPTPAGGTGVLPEPVPAPAPIETAPAIPEAAAVAPAAEPSAVPPAGPAPASAETPAAARGRSRKAPSAGTPEGAGDTHAPEASSASEPAPEAAAAEPTPAAAPAASAPAPAAASAGEAAPTPPAGARISDDHHYWWDEAASVWRRTPVSPDGYYYYDGSAWKPR